MYRIADFNIDFKNPSDYCLASFAPYKINELKADFVISCNEDEILAEQDSSLGFSRDYLQFIAFHRKLAELLPQSDAFVLHSACFSVDGVGVAFAAHSGTGKTTHLNRWSDFLGEHLTVINGDKPIIRFYENSPIAYGTPWNGKEKLGCNKSVPLKHICFIERSDRNFVTEMLKTEAVDRIFNQVYLPIKNPQDVFKTMTLIDKLLSECSIWKIHCNMDKNAGEIAYKEIFK